MHAVFKFIRKSKDGKPLSQEHDDFVVAKRGSAGDYCVITRLRSQPGKTDSVVEKVAFDDRKACVDYILSILALVGHDEDPYWALQADIGPAPSVLLKTESLCFPEVLASIRRLLSATLRPGASAEK